MKDLFNTIGVILVRGGGAILSLLVGLLIARNLGPEATGIFYVSLAVSSFSSAISRCGMINILVKYTSKELALGNFKEAYKLLNYVLCVVSCVSGLFVCFWMFFSPAISFSLFDSELYSEVLFTLSLSIFPVAILGVYSGFYNGRSWPVLAMFFLGFLGNFLFLVSLVGVSEVSIQLLASLYTVAMCVSSLFAIAGVVVLRKRENVNIHCMMCVIPGILGEAFVFWQIVLWNQVQQWSGQFIGAFYMNNAESGVLAICYSLAGVLLFIVMAIGAVYSPKFSRSETAFQMMSEFALSTLISTTLMFPVILIFAIFGEKLLSFYGNEYISGINILYILIFAQTCNVLCGPSGALLGMLGHQGILRRNTAYSVLFFILFLFALVPRYGAEGAALSTCLSIVFLNLINWFFIRNQLGFGLLSVYKRAVYIFKSKVFVVVKR